jgi:hypothetical protein
MDGQLFPSLIIATATVRPDEDEEQDPDVLGDAYAAVGISVTAPADGAKVKVTLRENSVMNTTTWTGELAKAGTEYFIGPKINYKFDQLRKNRQQVPLNVSFTLQVDGKRAGERTKTIALRTINDCPFRVANSEETIEQTSSGDDDESEETSGSTDSEEEDDDEYTDLGWMFAAYVNENSPIVDTILKEAIATGIVNGFGGYQGDRDAVLREVLAIWQALQDRGIKYSNITTTAGGSRLVYSQHVRFVDESLANEQANCVDGSVLFCSILRKLGLRSFLVSVPGHMYMGVYLTRGGDERIALETTVIGTDADLDKVRVDKRLAGLRDSLDKEVLDSASWKTFAAAAIIGTQGPGEERAEIRSGRRSRLPDHRYQRVAERRDHADLLREGGVADQAGSRRVTRPHHRHPCTR